jgi:hypothetical protein
MKRITIARWKELGEFFAEAPEIKKFIYGAADEDIRAKIDDLNIGDYPVLVGILPTILGTGVNFDIMGHESSLFYYCMVPKTNMSEEDTLYAWETTIAGIQGIVEKIRENYTSKEWRELYSIRPETIHIDPEYDMWECMGWSIGFDMEYED